MDLLMSPEMERDYQALLAQAFDENGQFRHVNITRIKLRNQGKELQLMCEDGLRNLADGEAAILESFKASAFINPEI